jgi:hypothetical protein
VAQALVRVTPGAGARLPAKKMACSRLTVARSGCPQRGVGYTLTVSVPLPDDDAIRSVVGDTYDPDNALNVIKMFAGNMYPAAGHRTWRPDSARRPPR